MKKLALLLLILVAACTTVVEPSIPDLENTVWEAEGNIRLSLWPGTMTSLRVPRGQGSSIVVYWGSYHVGHTEIVFRSPNEWPLEDAYLVSENQMRATLDDSIQVRLRRVEGEVPE